CPLARTAEIDADDYMMRNPIESGRNREDRRADLLDDPPGGVAPGDLRQGASMAETDDDEIAVPSVHLTSDGVRNGHSAAQANGPVPAAGRPQIRLNRQSPGVDCLRPEPGFDGLRWVEARARHRRELDRIDRYGGRCNESGR